MNGDHQPVGRPSVEGGELLPCPFCGSTDLVTVDDDSGDYRSAWEMWVECCTCDARSSQVKYRATAVETQEVAAEAWNRRTPDQALLDRIEKLEGALKVFAAAADHYEPDEGDDDDAAFASVFDVGDLRRARKALSGEKP